jgi:hypothetical protein
MAAYDVRNRVFAVEQPRRGYRVSTAVGLSARFPFVTPPGSIDVALPRWLEHQPETASVGFIDGGYLENSGLTAALLTALYIKDFLNKNEDVSGVDVRVIPIGDFSLATYGYYDSQSRN